MTGCALCNKKKPNRVSNESGSGVGKGAFESSMFRVTHWTRSKQGKQTEIVFRPDHHFGQNMSPTVLLEGHLNLKSDEGCMANFNVKEQVRMISAAIRHGERLGRVELQEQFQTLMNIRGRGYGGNSGC